MLEEGNQLELRVSALDEDIEEMETSDEEDVIVSFLILDYSIKQNIHVLYFQK